MLDPLRLPLTGKRLIEASAGTGKTYTLVLLYLRLLLGLGQSSAFFRRLSVTDILVVTFTQAATEELRDRIRTSIHSLRAACLSPSHGKSHPLLPEITNKAEAAALLLIAQRQMDEACIFTIHGFCQRILTIHAFEAGLPFQQTLIQDESAIRLEAANDFWRKYFYPLPAPLVDVVLQYWRDPQDLLQQIQFYLSQERLTLPTVKAPEMTSFSERISALHERILTTIDSVKMAWKAVSTEIEVHILSSGINKRSYSKRYLPNWIAQMTQWAEQETRDYTIPAVINRFAQSQLLEKTPDDAKAPDLPVFTHIDRFLSEPNDLKSVIIFEAITHIRALIKEKKQKLVQCGFDDLLTQLQAILSSEKAGEALAADIAKRYPVAMVDEFQDTDPVQYSIFNRIYSSSPESALLMIGDPKQAIYGFRGADIFTYIQAKSAIESVYTMETNWRSSGDMVNSVNRLFSRLNDTFIFKQIPFHHVNASAEHQTAHFSLHQQPQPALQFCVLPDAVSASEYRHRLADFCAESIQHWLTAGQQGQATCVKNGQCRTVSSSDIAILVRTRDEARIIKEALLKRHIQSVYLSNRDTVFDTQEAKALFRLLQAVLQPENEHFLRSALAGHLLGFSFRELDELSHDESSWDAKVEQFMQYQRCWFKQGVLPMLRMIMTQHHIAETLLAASDGERRLTDLLHLGELLQEASFQVDSEYALVRWLLLQMTSDDQPGDSQQQRLESDKNLVKIVTIHKSKGLEYPLVWLPFAGLSRKAKQAFYHERTHFSPTLSLPATDEALALADEERLAEDIRLLYVAVTRAIYHCSIGIAAVKERNTPILHHSALGHLLGQTEKSDIPALLMELNALGNVVMVPDETPVSEFSAEQAPEITLAAKQFSRRVKDNWHIASYSYLAQQAELSPAIPETLRLSLDNPDTHLVDVASEKDEFQRTVHQFPKGARVGVVLHALMESLDFTQPVPPDRIWHVLQQLDLDDTWFDVMMNWVQQIVTTSLDGADLSLSQIAPSQRLIELQFYLPVNRDLSSADFSELARQYDPLSARCPAVTFAQFSGMLKGFIDVVFCWKGKYYLLDYKSNWLGENDDDYQQDALIGAMCMHRYDLQYQLYTLALHRYLKHRLPNYDYETHFGGVYYLFLRGMTPNLPFHGIFSYKPPEIFIEKLDALLG